MLVAREFLKNSQFPIIGRDLPKAAKYASLWATKDATRIHDSKIFWVFMEMNLRIWINCKPRLSTTVYNSLQSFAEFNADMHNIYISARKDPTKQWTKLHFVATDDAIFSVLEAWLPEWRTPDIAKIKKSVV